MTTTEFHVPPGCQGQAVETCYATTDDGHVIRHTYDDTDRSSRYAIGRRLAGDEGDYWNAPPRNRRWRPMTPAELKAYGLA